MTHNVDPYNQVVRITEIYKSIQGESSFAGLPCIFIRLTGCPLRCRWCDTSYGFEGGEDYTVRRIVDKVKANQINLVEMTGGEPLAQPASISLAEALCREGFKVLIETSGSEPIEDLPKDIHIIMDLKCPGSGMVDRNRLENLAFLKASDEVKFVIADRADFEWAAATIHEHNLGQRFKCLLSPAFGLLKPDVLVSWMLDAQLPVRLNLQIHKFIWNPRKKGV